MKSKQRHEGYLLIDHRAGPGLSPEEALPVGAIPVAGGVKYESATNTCSHCCRVVVLNPNRSRVRGYCPKCDHYVCDECEAARVAAGGECVTFMQFADESAEKAVRAAAPAPNLPLIYANLRS